MTLRPVLFAYVGFVLLLAAPGCRRSPYAIDKATHDKEMADWKEKRLTRLSSETGWLTLVGLFWLKEGENTMGSDSSNAIIFPAGTSSAVAGSLILEKGIVRLSARPGVEMRSGDSVVTSAIMHSDAESARRSSPSAGSPSRSSNGSTSWEYA